MLSKVLLYSVVTAGAVLADRTTIKKVPLSVINSETLPGNLLPGFMFMQGAIEGGSVGVKLGGGRGTPLPFTPDDSCTDDIFEGANEDLRSPQLPYLTQDMWTCDRKTEDIDSWQMESEDITVTVTPQFAGKVWGIFDKKNDREWLFANRAHQPANIGALKSWAAGGSEWNWSPGIIGHSAFSETQVYLARIETERGDLLRVYEYDRYNSSVWQVDMAIVNGSFVAHPRITNPTDCDLRGYWWTCVAVDAKPSTRIFSPATHVAETTREPMRDAPWPNFAGAIENASFTGYDGQVGADMSYLQNYQIGDMFLRIPQDQVYTPYIAHTQEDGFVLVHGHPLNGTKFFTWGQSGPGRFMQDFLAGGGKRQGDYAELQVGPAPTQMQTFPVPSRSVKEWTEWFKGFNGDVDTLYGAYDGALDLIDEWMRKPDEGMPQEVVGDWDAFFERHATDEPAEILTKGQPWGALEELRLGHRMVEGLRFELPPASDETAYAEVRPWVELVKHGTFSEATLAVMPTSYQTTDAWYELLQRSVSEHSATWLHNLFLGIARTERGDVAEPLQLFARSMEQRPNPVAARCIAVLQQTQEAAWPYFEQAWKVLHEDFSEDPSYDRLAANLVTEMSFFLQQAGWYDSMQSFLVAVPEKYRQNDAYITMQVMVNLHNGEYDAAAAILGKECFPTYAKARADLMDMWNSAQEGIAQQAKGHGATLTNVEKHQARVRNPVPENIGCQYASEYCSTYW
jgi:hypothetical protein